MIRIERCTNDTCSKPFNMETKFGPKFRWTLGILWGVEFGEKVAEKRTSENFGAKIDIFTTFRGPKKILMVLSNSMAKNTYIPQKIGLSHWGSDFRGNLR